MLKYKLLCIPIFSTLLTTSLAASAKEVIVNNKDSVNSWGKWSQNYEPAAGGEFSTGVLAFASTQQSETGYNKQNTPNVNETPEVPEVPTACQAGSYCGHSFIITSENKVPTHDIGHFYLEVTPDYFLQNDKENEGPNAEAAFTAQGKAGTVVVESGIPGTLGSVNPYNPFNDFEDETEVKTRYLSYSKYEARFNLPSEGLFGGGWNISETDKPVYYGFFVGGITTSASQLNEFTSNLNGPIASYTGHSFGGANFQLSINFADKSWEGSWNSGADGQTIQHTGNIENGLYGEVGFNVKGGQISGVNFSASSNNLSAHDGQVTGSVTGALFGDQAQSVSGIIDIEKTSNSYNTHHRAIFVGSQIE